MLLEQPPGQLPLRAGIKVQIIVASPLTSEAAFIALEPPGSTDLRGQHQVIVLDGNFVRPRARLIMHRCNCIRTHNYGSRPSGESASADKPAATRTPAKPATPRVVVTASWTRVAGETGGRLTIRYINAPLKNSLPLREGLRTCNIWCSVSLGARRWRGWNYPLAQQVVPLRVPSSGILQVLVRRTCRGQGGPYSDNSEYPCRNNWTVPDCSPRTEFTEPVPARAR